MLLCDMVFQGTVLGPSLWNAFVADVAYEVPTGRQSVNLFADDLTGQTYRRSDSSRQGLVTELEQMQRATHEWGGAKSGYL